MYDASGPSYSSSNNDSAAAQQNKAAQNKTVRSTRANPHSLQQTTCAYCGVGCGVDIQLQHQQSTGAAAAIPVALQGTPEHPANFGRLCVKGTHLLDTIGSPNEDDPKRLLQPEIYGKAVSWQKATDYIADKLQNIITTHGADAVAMYVSGQLLTEDYYVANKFMKGYVGTANIDTNSRLCMASAVAAYKRAFGEDVVPCNYEDIEHTDLLVLVGSNAAWTHPVLFQRIERAKQLRNLQVVVIDPRETATASIADLFLGIKPGSDTALFNGLLRFLKQHNGLDHDFINQHTDGFYEALQWANPWSVDMVADYCGLTSQQVLDFYQLFLQSDRAVSFYSMGINQSSSGVDKCNAIINVHLASGKILRKGCGPFSITGQPNAMGGREVGGLANQLAAHMDIDNDTHREQVQAFWQAPRMASEQGLKAVDLFEHIAQGKVKAVWIMATNPLVSVPNRNRVREALRQCDLVIVSDCVNDAETLSYAHIKLPATGWLEKDGTVTNSERRISRQRAIMPAMGEARHDWRIMCDVAQKMGFIGFDYQHPADIFDEYVRLTGFANQGKRQLDLSPLQGMTRAEYDTMQPVQWPMNANRQPVQVFADALFSTDNKRARFIAVEQRSVVQKTSDDFPFTLNSGRLRDQWHTMTRTGRSAILNSHSRIPSLTLHPDDADALGVSQHHVVAVQSPSGCAVCFVDVSTSVSRRNCFMPIHWSQSFANSANVSNLYASVVDPISGQPESKQAAVAIHKLATKQYWQVFYRTQDGQASVSQSCSGEFNSTLAAPSMWVKSLLSHCQMIIGSDIDLAELANAAHGSDLTQYPLNKHKTANHKAANHKAASQKIAADKLKALYLAVQNVLFATHSNTNSHADDALMNSATDAHIQQQQQELLSRAQRWLNTGASEWLVANPKEHVSVVLGLSNGALNFVAVVTPNSSDATQLALPESWVDALFAQDTLTLSQIQSLLRAAPEPEFLLGRQVCSCFKVHETSIINAITEGHDSVDKLGKSLSCGTNCGSCRSELQQLVTLHGAKVEGNSSKDFGNAVIPVTVLDDTNIHSHQ